MATNLEQLNIHTDNQRTEPIDEKHSYQLSRAAKHRHFGITPFSDDYL